VKRTKNEHGYSLVEVIVATAILGLVLLSVMTLFFMGRRNVYSGKQRTKANTVATRVLEDLSYLTASEVLAQTGLDDDTPAPSGSCACVKIKNTDSGVTAFVNQWDDYTTQAEMTNANVELTLTPTGGTAGTEFTTATFLRIDVRVNWAEERRQRTVLMSTAKVQRQ